MGKIKEIFRYWTNKKKQQLKSEYECRFFQQKLGGCHIFQHSFEFSFFRYFLFFQGSLVLLKYIYQNITSVLYFGKNDYIPAKEKQIFENFEVGNFLRKKTVETCLGIIFLQIFSFTYVPTTPFSYAHYYFWKNNIRV